MQIAKRSMETLTVTLKMRQKELQEQGEEGDTASEDPRQISWGVKQKLGCPVPKEYPVSREERNL